LMMMRRGGGDQRCAHRDDKASRDGFIVSFGKECNEDACVVAKQTQKFR